MHHCSQRKMCLRETARIGVYILPQARQRKRSSKFGGENKLWDSDQEMYAKQGLCTKIHYADLSWRLLHR